MEHAGLERDRAEINSAPPPKRTDLTPREQWGAAKREFVRAAIADAEAYTEMTVDEVEKEYRRAGKLHRYDPDTEWMKHFARVARKHPPPEGLVPEMDDYLKLLEEDEAN
ncbi:hypothetical protein BAE44_0013463 [Dichanthelium oligosanthes]|uniref:Uncharacterized protein n=1 Tax=Dichanthelium oligosanthes TaxID=888268 RepID=A0A1E5VK46_9POAL|nr:hypothetical protein BAE44_0013463 [Dichanthelium oligosanthes]